MTKCVKFSKSNTAWDVLLKKQQHCSKADIASEEMKSTCNCYGWNKAYAAIFQLAGMDTAAITDGHVVSNNVLYSRLRKRCPLPKNLLPFYHSEYTVAINYYLSRYFKSLFADTLFETLPLYLGPGQWWETHGFLISTREMCDNEYFYLSSVAIGSGWYHSLSFVGNEMEFSCSSKVILYLAWWVVQYVGGILILLLLLVLLENFISDCEFDLCLNWI